MKSILDYVICCRSGAGRSEASRTEETLSFAVPSPLREISRRESRRYNSSERGRAATRSGVYWKPSLCSISEDKVASESGRGILAVSDRILKRKVSRSTTTTRSAAAASTNTNRVHVHSYGDDIGRSGFSMIIPSFSATAFIF